MIFYWASGNAIKVRLIYFIEIVSLARYRLNEITLVSGHTGHGKSTWLSEYSIDLAEQGVSGTYYGSFENRIERFQKTQGKMK